MEEQKTINEQPVNEQKPIEKTNENYLESKDFLNSYWHKQTNVENFKLIPEEKRSKFLFNSKVTGKNYSLESIIKFPFRGNIRDLFDVPANDEISLITDIIVFAEPNKEKLTPSEDNIDSIIQYEKKYLVPIGNNLVHYNNQVNDVADKDDIYYINLNTKTGDLIIDYKDSVKDTYNNKDYADKTTLGFFFDISSTSVDNAIEKEYNDYIDSLLNPETSEISKHFVFVSFDMENDEKEKLNSDIELKTKYGIKIVEWLKSIQSFDKKTLVSKFKSGYVFDVEVTQDDIKDFKFDKMALLNSFYPEIIKSVIEVCDDIEMNDKGIPVLTDEDKKCLEFLGIKKEDIDGIINLSLSTIDSSIQMIEANSKTIDDSEFKANAFDAECVLCPVINTDRAEEELNKNISYLVTKQECLEDIKNAEEYIKSQKEGIASFQMMARYQVKKQMENGDFKNYHTFTAAMIFFTAMKRSMIVYAEEGKDNYGALNAFYDFALDRINYINEHETNYFENRVFNSLHGSVSESYLSSFRNFIQECLLPSVSYSKTMDDENLFPTLINEVNLKEMFIDTMSTYPLKGVLNFSKNINSILNFESSKEKDISDRCDSIKKMLFDLGFKFNFDFDKETSELEVKLTEIRNFIDTNYEKIVSFCRVILVLLLNTVTKTSEKKAKSLLKALDICSDFISVSSITKYLDVITTKKIKEMNDKNEEVEREITDDENKNIIFKFFLGVSSKEVMCGVYNRLYDKMEDVCESIQNNESRDIGSYFSAVIGFMLVCSEVLAKVKDDGLNDSLVNTFDLQKQKAIGKDAIEIFVSGLSGKEEDGSSRLNVGRNNIIKTNIKLVSLFADVTLNVLNKIV